MDYERDNFERLEETVTLSQAKDLIKSLSKQQSLLLLSPPGVGKSDVVRQAAREGGLPCRSLLGTQIAPEDVSGVPHIVGERSVFCPPRVLLPEKAEPFCLFLDELPASPPDIQKAFYSLLLERRIGENELPGGTWVVAAGNRVEDRALVRTISSALVNRVFVLQVRVDVNEWLIWAKANGIRPEVISFITFMGERALMRPVPNEPVPFSTPRSWEAVSRAFDMMDASGVGDTAMKRALVFGRVSAEDAAIFSAMLEEHIDELLPLEQYIRQPEQLPKDDAALWFVLCWIRDKVKFTADFDRFTSEEINDFLVHLPQEHLLALLCELVEEWGELGADETLLQTLKEVTGL